MTRLYSNNFFSSLLVAASSSATTLYLASTTNIPTISGSDYFNLTLDDLNGTIEIVKVTAVTSNALTVVRAQESTTARAWPIHSLIELRYTATSLNVDEILAGVSLTPVTPAAGDLFLIEDVSDGNAIKGATLSDVGAYAKSLGVTDGDYGDITVSGTGAVWTIDTAAVSLAKMANIATSTFIGRTTAGTGVPEALTTTQAKNLLWPDASYTDVTFSSNGSVISINNNVVTLAKLATVDTARFLGRTTAGSGNVEALTTAQARAMVFPDATYSDITLSGSGATWTIGAGTVTLAKMANMATTSLLGRSTAGTGAPEVLSAATAKTVLSLNNVENTALSTWAGSSNITTAGAVVLTSVRFGSGSILSNYDEAQTFTPTFTFATVGDLSVSYAVQTGYYWRVGKLIFISMTIRCTPTYTTATGDIRFGGLPFTVSGTTNYRGTATISESSTWPTSATGLLSAFQNSNTYVYIQGAGTGIAPSNLSTTTYPTGVQRTIVITGMYTI